MKAARVATALVAAATLWLAAPSARAGLTTVSEGSAAYTFHFFTDVDGVDVYTQHAASGARFGRNTAFAIQWAHDVVVIPGIEAPPGSQEAVDAITTASRPITNPGDPFEDFVKVRDELQGSMTYRNARATYYVSKEVDWFAQMVTAEYTQDLLGSNLNLTGGVSYGWDDITPLKDLRGEGVPDEQTTLHGHLVATQILTPTTVLRGGVEYNEVRGLQHDPYRNVYVDGTNVPESHPTARDRYVAFARVSQYINNRSSVKVDYRYYTDDWGVDSHTIGGKLSQYVTDDVVVRYRYRYYTQVPAVFFRDEYDQAGGVGGLQTGDYRLGDYGAHLFGGNILWRPYRALGRIGFLERSSLIFTYEHYFNSNNFSANVYEAGLRFSF